LFHGVADLFIKQVGAFNPLLAGFASARKSDAPLDLTVGVAAEYNSACVNTLRRPTTVETPRSPEKSGGRFF